MLQLRWFLRNERLISVWSVTAKCKIPICPLDRVTLHALPVRNIPKFKDRANWSRDTFQPMRRCASVYQNTNQNIAPVIIFTIVDGVGQSVIVLRISGIFLRLFMRHTYFFEVDSEHQHFTTGLSKDVSHPNWPMAGSFSRLLQTLSH